MSTTSDTTTEDALHFHDYLVPALPGGDWKIRIDHDVRKDNTALNVDGENKNVPLFTEQHFMVTAPQINLPPGAVSAQFPPAGGTGLWRDVLPHIVFSDANLPWERSLSATSRNYPWLALLVFTDEELTCDTANAVKSNITTFADFLKLPDHMLRGKITPDETIPKETSCAYIRISTDKFKELLPHAEETELLAHCRKVETHNKAENHADDVLFSVIVANRFPATPAVGEHEPKKNIVHLVSLEGFEEWLKDAPDFGKKTEVALLSLCSWTFSVQEQSHTDFKGLVNKIVTTKNDKDQSLLRLPLPNNADEKSITVKRIRSGFVPMPYHSRTGENTMAWYRGPLTPERVEAVAQKEPFASADGAIIYDRAQGVFDVSLATAWTLGRSLALQDKAFALHLYELRRKLHRKADQWLHRQSSQFFSTTETEKTMNHNHLFAEMSKCIQPDLLTAIGKHVPVKKDNIRDKPDTQNHTMIHPANFLANEKLVAHLRQVAGENDEEISAWIAKLMLLYPVPLNHFVPAEQMLPDESLRFFYVDVNWLHALADGALSIGVESSREIALHAVLHPVIKANALRKTGALRTRKMGIQALDVSATTVPVCGLILRSALVSGWPGLTIAGKRNGKADVKTLRFEKISSSLMLCLFDDIPDYIELAEPHESLCFGTDDEGAIPLRNFKAPSKPSDAQIGEQLPSNPVLKIRDRTGKEKRCMRTINGRTVQVNELRTQLKSANTTIDKVIPSVMAVQMVKSPEAIRIYTLNKPTA